MNGFRIELGEIEHVLAQVAGVDECVVVARTDARGESRLAGYAVGTATVDQMRSALSSSLAHYMVPPDLLVLDELPRTPNGKTDRSALPDPSALKQAAQPRPTDEPRSEIERLLVTTVGRVLELDQVSVFDNFFDLGGSSVLSLRVVDAIDDSTGVRLNPAEFVQQNLRQIAAAWERQEADPTSQERGFFDRLKGRLARRRR